MNETSYRLFAVRVFSFRWQESVQFYRDVLCFPLVFLDEQFGWAEFDLGSARFGLERCRTDDPESQDLVGRFVGISIEVDDIAGLHEELSLRGVEFLGPPARQPWGGVLAHFKDPDGNVVSLLSRDLQSPSGRESKRS